MDKNRLYYKDAYLREFSSRVVSCTEKNGLWELELENTAFYPLSGGQLSDTGMINGVRVLRCEERGERVMHILERPVSAADEAHCEIDFSVRLDHMQQHTGEHLLSGLVHRKFGYDNVGFHMNDDLVTVDYSGPITREELFELERECERAVLSDLPVTTRWITSAELKGLDCRSKKELAGDIRLVNIEGVDLCACCGTHVRRTSEIGGVRLLSCAKYKSGVRIEMICGMRIARDHRALFEQNAEISRLLSAKPGQTALAVEALTGEFEREKEKRKALFADWVELKKMTSGGERLYFEAGLDGDQLRILCLALGDSAVFTPEGDGFKYAVFFPDRPDLAAKMNAALSGRGGGKDGFAQGAVKCEKEDIVRFFEREFNF